jgi:hypothetical protein
VPVRPVFRCDFCDAQPDEETQRSLVAQMLDLRHGEYVDAEPGRWLKWTGRGLLGPTRYSCGAHRGDLKAVLREQYGTVGPQVWAMGPHPWSGPAGTERARRLLRTGRGGFAR